MCEDDGLVVLVHEQVVGIAVGKDAVSAYHKEHLAVEIGQERISQLLAVAQRPLAPCVVVRPAVALAREVDPFGVSEFVAHEVEVCLAARRDGHQTYHLVQGHAAVDEYVLGFAVHRVVHQTVHQTEGYGLVTHECLIVRLGIGYGLDTGQTVCHDRPHLPNVPILVGCILEHLDPEVGYRHAEAVVEPHAAVVWREADAGHAAYLLGYGYGRGAEVMHQTVCEC